MSSSASCDIQDQSQRQMAHWTRISQESSYHNLMDAALKKPLLSLLQVTVEDGLVFITAKKKVLTLPAVPEHRQHLRLRVTSAFCTLLQDLESSLRVKDTSRRCLLNKNTMLLLGGGQRRALPSPHMLGAATLLSRED